MSWTRATGATTSRVLPHTRHVISSEETMRGEVIEIVGRLSSGRTSLLTAWLTDVTRRGGFVALVDADGAFDPSSAVRAGVDLRRLLWVRTRSEERRVGKG